MDFDRYIETMVIMKTCVLDYLMVDALNMTDLFDAEFDDYYTLEELENNLRSDAVQRMKNTYGESKNYTIDNLVNWSEWRRLEDKIGKTTAFKLEF